MSDMRSVLFLTSSVPAPGSVPPVERAEVSAKLLLKRGNMLVSDEVKVREALRGLVRAGNLPADALQAADTACTTLMAAKEKANSALDQLEDHAPKQSVPNAIHDAVHELEAALNAVRADVRFPGLPAAPKWNEKKQAKLVKGARSQGCCCRLLYTCWWIRFGRP